MRSAAGPRIPPAGSWAGALASDLSEQAHRACLAQDTRACVSRVSAAPARISGTNSVCDAD